MTIFFITNREKLNETIKRFDCEAIHNGSHVYSSYTIKWKLTEKNLIEISEWGHIQSES